MNAYDTDNELPVDPRARTGRSTGIALQFIGAALQTPNTWLPIQDHHPTRQATKDLMGITIDLVEKLGLKGFLFKKDNLCIKYELPWGGKQ